MAEEFYTILTNTGRAAIANASATGRMVEFTDIVLGDGNGSYHEPRENQTKLINQVFSTNINNIKIDDNNPNWIRLSSIIDGEDGGFTIREVGVLNKRGELLVIGKYPETYKPTFENGSMKDLVINVIIEVTNTDAVELKVDPTVVIATQKDIEDMVVRNHDNSVGIENIIKTDADSLGGKPASSFSSKSDVNTRISNHNKSSDTHQDIRTSIDNIDVDGGIRVHNSDSNAHRDIRSEVDKQATPANVDSKISTHNSDDKAHPELMSNIDSKIDTHNTDNGAHTDIQADIDELEDLDVVIRGNDAGSGVGKISGADIDTFDGNSPSFYTSISQLEAHKSDTGAHQDIRNQISSLETDNSRLTSDKTITGAINEVFTNVSSGKESLASAITDMGFNTSKDDSFDIIKEQLNKLDVDYYYGENRTSGGTNWGLSHGLGYKPTVFIGYYFGKSGHGDDVSLMMVYVENYMEVAFTDSLVREDGRYDGNGTRKTIMATRGHESWGNPNYNEHAVWDVSSSRVAVRIPEGMFRRSGVSGVHLGLGIDFIVF